jgi:hypothetical protein
METKSRERSMQDCQGLDINVVSYKYGRMRQKKETNLVVVAFEVEVGTGKLGLDDLPEPVHGRAVRDVR